jgi:hypothetical protein
VDANSRQRKTPFAGKSLAGRLPTRRICANALALKPMGAWVRLEPQVNLTTRPRRRFPQNNSDASRRSQAACVQLGRPGHPVGTRSLWWRYAPDAGTQHRSPLHLKGCCSVADLFRFGNIEVRGARGNNLMCYTWSAYGLVSVVTWTLTASGTGTHLCMERSGFRQDPADSGGCQRRGGRVLCGPGAGLGADRPKSVCTI